MQKDERDLLEVLKFELNFVEKGGYGLSLAITPSGQKTRILPSSP